MTKEITCALLAEPHHGLAEGTRLLLATLFDVVVMVADDCSLIETAERVKPDLFVIDLVLAKRNLAGLLSCLRERSPESKVLVLSVHDERAIAQRVIEAGADGFLAKSAVGSELLPAVEALLRGERYTSRSIDKADTVEN